MVNLSIKNFKGGDLDHKPLKKYYFVASRQMVHNLVITIELMLDFTIVTFVDYTKDGKNYCQNEDLDRFEFYFEWLHSFGICI